MADVQASETQRVSLPETQDAKEKLFVCRPGKRKGTIENEMKKQILRKERRAKYKRNM